MNAKPALDLSDVWFRRFPWIMMAVFVVIMALASGLGSRLFGPTRDMAGNTAAYTIFSGHSQADLVSCLLGDDLWRDEPVLQRSRAPDNRPDIVRLYHPLTKLIIDVVDQGTRRQILAYAPPTGSLSKARRRGIDYCVMRWKP